MFRGSASIDTGRYKHQQQKQRTKFTQKYHFPTDPFGTKIDMRKIKFKAMHSWIKNEISEILGFEDEVVHGLIINLFESPNGGTGGDHLRHYQPDPREITLSITGFLDADALPFMTRLWRHLIAAQESNIGIDPQILAKAAQRSKKKKLRNQMKQLFVGACEI